MSKLLGKFGFEILELEPVISKDILFTYFKFLRKKNPPISYKQFRHSDKGYQLNFLGNFTYKIINKYFAYQYTFALSFVARKVRDL